jgi:hypothetical protein
LLSIVPLLAVSLATMDSKVVNVRLPAIWGKRSCLARRTVRRTRLIIDRAV